LKQLPSAARVQAYSDPNCIDAAGLRGLRSGGMQEFLDFVLRQLVDHPDDIILTKHEAPRKVVFKLRLRKTDIGKVVGKHGQTLTAIRGLLNAASSRHGQRAFLDIVEDDVVSS
jgi:uncharacterized protein